MKTITESYLESDLGNLLNVQMEIVESQRKLDAAQKVYEDCVAKKLQCELDLAKYFNRQIGHPHTERNFLIRQHLIRIENIRVI